MTSIMFYALIIPTFKYFVCCLCGFCV